MSRSGTWDGSGGAVTIPPVGGNDPWDIPGDVLIAGGYPVIDVTHPTFGARWDGASDDTTPLLSAAAAAQAMGGAIIQVPQGFGKFSALSLAGLSGVRFKGIGRAQSGVLFTTTTGTVVDMTNASFCGFEDLLFRPLSAQKTAGELFKLNAAAGSCQQNRFAGLNLASCYRAFNLGSTTQNLFDDLLMQDFSPSHAWHSLFHLSGAAISNTFTRIRGGSGSDSGQVMLVDGAGVDTVICDDWKLASNPGTSLQGMTISAGEWFQLNNISLEAGTNAHGFETNGSPLGITLTNFHLLGLRGAYIKGGKGIKLLGGDALACQREGLKADAFATIKHLKFHDVVVSDCGLATTNTYDGISIGANVNDFSIQGCTSDDASILGSSNRVRYGCNIDAANDRFTIRGNHFYGATGKLNNAAGVGATKVADGNI